MVCCPSKSRALFSHSAVFLSLTDPFSALADEVTKTVVEVVAQNGLKCVSPGFRREITADRRFLASFLLPSGLVIAVGLLLLGEW